MRRAGIERLGSFVPHPPANALLLTPVARLSPEAAKTAWTLVLAAGYAATALLLPAASGLGAWSAALVLLLPSAALANALAYGQPYPLLLLALTGSLLLLLRGRELLSGLALAPALVVKPYGLPLVALLLLMRRWRAAAGALLGASVCLGISVAALGAPLHGTYLREILPRSLRGEVQDPYSPLWGGFASLAHRLFQREPDLNPSPAWDAPALVAPLGAGLAALVLALGLTARPPLPGPAGLRRRFAAVTLAALAASPLAQSYHFVLLALPVAVLVSQQRSPAARAATLALYAFATSPLPHHFAPLAHGWANLAAYPRLLALLALLTLALAEGASRRRVAACLGIAAAVGLAAFRFPEVAPGARVDVARGYLAAEPVSCGGSLAWLAIQGDRYVVRTSDGGTLEAATDLVEPRCRGGRPAARALPGPDAGPEDDVDRDAAGAVRADRETGALMAVGASGSRRLAVGRFRRPRLSPDGLRVAVESWEDGSWEIRVFERAGGGSLRVTAQRSNELEPDWAPDGRGLIFASDWRRGLGSTALYRVELR